MLAVTLSFVLSCSFPSLISICNALLPLAWTQHTVITLTVIDISSYGLAASAIIYLWYTFMKITISCMNTPKWSPYASVIIYDILRNYLISALCQLLFWDKTQCNMQTNDILNFLTTLKLFQTTITKILANKNRIFKAVESEENRVCMVIYTHSHWQTFTKQLTGIHKWHKLKATYKDTNRLSTQEKKSIIELSIFRFWSFEISSYSYFLKTKWSRIHHHHS